MSCNSAWIPFKDADVHSMRAEFFTAWITVEFPNGYRRAIKARWDPIQSIFIHSSNGMHIKNKVVAYMPYSAPDPYDG